MRRINNGTMGLTVSSTWKDASKTEGRLWSDINQIIGRAQGIICKPKMPGQSKGYSQEKHRDATWEISIKPGRKDSENRKHSSGITPPGPKGDHAPWKRACRPQSPTTRREQNQWRSRPDFQANGSLRPVSQRGVGAKAANQKLNAR